MVRIIEKRRQSEEVLCNLDKNESCMIAKLWIGLWVAYGLFHSTQLTLKSYLDDCLVSLNHSYSNNVQYLCRFIQIM